MSAPPPCCERSWNNMWKPASPWAAARSRACYRKSLAGHHPQRDGGPDRCRAVVLAAHLCRAAADRAGPAPVRGRAAAVRRSSPRKSGSISQALVQSGRSMEDTLAEASPMLSGLSAAAGLVLAPKGEGAVKHIEFVPLSPGRALVVLVSPRPGGKPDHRDPAQACHPARCSRRATTSMPGSRALPSPSCSAAWGMSWWPTARSWTP